jgi:protein required for attachment to host cells
MTVWILVSDTSRAKLLSAELREDDWSLVKDFEHPEGRELSKDIVSSPPGRSHQSKVAGTQRTAMEPHTPAKEVEADRFAQLLANYLEQATAQRQFDYLVLVAPPHFLGKLHGTLGKQAAKHLRSTVDKDLAMLDAAELRRRLLDVVFPIKAESS